MEDPGEKPPKSFLGEEDWTTLTSYLDSPKLIQASTNASRLLNKLKSAVENQALYETQQILRTIHFRFINNPEKVDALVDLLYYGAIHQLERAEYISGQDIATLFLEAVAKKLVSHLESSGTSVIEQGQTQAHRMYDHRENETVDIIICRKISSLAILLPDNELGRARFVAEALRLLPPKLLHRDLLHEILALRFYISKDYVNARYHLLHSACASYQGASIILNFQSEKGFMSEVDLFLTQFVLQYLCIQNPTDSPVAPGHQRNQRNSVTTSNLTVSRKSRKEIRSIVLRYFYFYLERCRHPDVRTISKPLDMPLLNFTLLLIYILDSEKSEADAFKFLVETYRKPLQRDTSFQNYLDRIGVLYFGLSDPTKQQQQHLANSGGGGLFNNILMSLLDEGDDEDDASTEHTSTNMSYDELD